MQTRYWNSIIGTAITFAALTSPIFAGAVAPGTGGISKCGGAEGQSGDSGKDNSDPIYLASGDFQHVQQDLFIPGRGLDFKIKRHYRSRSGFKSTSIIHPNPPWINLPADPAEAPIVGINWDMNYNMRISFGQGVEPDGPFLPQPSGPVLTPIGYNKPNTIYVFMGNGRVDPFLNNGSSSGEHPATGQSGSVYDNELYGMVLHFTGPGYSAQLIDGDMTTYSFYATHDHSGNYYEYGGMLKNIIDKNGNEISFHYETSNGVDRIDYAIDTLNHSIGFTYHDDAGSPISDPLLAYLLWKVEDHAGRTAQYEYTDARRMGSGNFTKLTTVTLPSIDTDSANGFILDYSDNGITVDHGRFPNGLVWQYDYAPATAGAYGDGLISSITDPNGVEVIQNTYEHNGNGARDRGRVTRQQYGDEAYNYVVTELSGNEIFPPTNSLATDYYVWVNDRRGAITRFKYSRFYQSNEHRPLVHRQLLEKTEFIGFVANADQRVWATCASDEDGTPTTWHYFDAAGVKQVLTPGPQTDTGASGMTIQRWTTNSNWNPTAIYAPIEGDYTTISYDTNATDARRWGAMLSRTRHANGEPSISETWAYNFSDSLGAGCGCGGSDDFATGYKDGNGNITIKEFDTDGNLIKIFHDVPPGSGVTIDSDPNAPGSAVANAASAIEEFTYNQWGQVLTHTHPEKTILDEFGSEAQHSRVDQFIYYPDNPVSDPANSGRLHQKIVDSGGESLATTYEYDLIGNVIKVTGPGGDTANPDGDITEYLYNQASQLVREEHFASNGTDLFAENTYFYDANGNLTIEETKNLDGDQNIVGTNKAFTKVYRYDDLNFRVSASSEHGVFTGTIAEETDGSHRVLATAISDTDPDFVTQKWEYDPNRNLKKAIGGEAVNGTQAENVTEYEYDYRDLLIKRTRGLGESNALIATAIYDEKGRAESVTLDPSGNTQSEHYDVVYDGFDRVVSITDPMGNETNYKYDQNHNIVESYFCGPHLYDNPPGGSDSGDTLARQTSVFDERDRVISKTVDVFGYDYNIGTGETCGQTPGSSTQEVTEYVYNPDSSLRTIKELSGIGGSLKLTDYYYDTVSRLTTVVDGDGNDSVREYDDDSNIIKTIYTDVSTIIGEPQEVFEVLYGYDALDRRTATTDGAGNLATTKYDSRNNAVELSDARGNITNNTIDGLNRLTETSVVMTDTGDGYGTQISGDDGTIVTSKTYDDSSRLISETDDNGNTTSYEYDGLNRITRIIMPDNEDYTTTYDHNGNVDAYIDARGVVVSHLYDLNNRLETRTMSGTSVPGTTTENFFYDGLGRLRQAINDFTLVEREYDSRSNVVREIQNADAPSFPETSDRIVQYNHDDANNMTQIVYPSGRTIDRSYDILNRLVSINDQQLTNPLVTQFDYIGSRLARRTNGNGTQTDYSYNGYEGHVGNGDLGFGRVASISTTKISNSAVLDAFDFTWDANQNRNAYNDTGSGMINRRERSFGYDSSNRLISTDVDYPNPLTDYTAPINDGITDYALDGVHNRVDVTGFDENGAQIGSYAVNENNQYTDTPRASGADWTYLYDQNGNMILKAQDSFADFNDDYEFDFFDVTAFLEAYGNGDLSADTDGSGTLDFFDVSSFLTEHTENTGMQLVHVDYTYDFRNQLISVTRGVGVDTPSTVTNVYDALARRVVEKLDVDDGVTVVHEEKQMVYGCASLWEVIEQIDLQDDEVLSTHVFGLGIDDEVHYQRPNASQDQSIWSHRDDLNTLTSITNESGTVLERFEYGDFGLVSVFDGAGNAQSGTSKGATHLYTGRPLIPGTGLYDYRFRVLSSGLGRFVQRDPLGYKESMSLYAYVSNSPASYSDPSGLYRINYKGFTQAQRLRIRKALRNACNRISKMGKELEKAKSKIKEEWGDCVANEMAPKLDRLDSRLADMERQCKDARTDINFTEDKNTDENGSVNAETGPSIRWTNDLLTYTAPPYNIELNNISGNDWNTKSDAQIGQLILHELVHVAEFSTSDYDYDAWDNEPVNAHKLEQWFKKPISPDSSPLKGMLQTARLKCRKTCSEE